MILLTALPSFIPILVGGVLVAGCTHFTKPPPPLAQDALANLAQQIVDRTLDPAQGGATVELRSGRMVELGTKYISVSRAGGIALPAVAPASRLTNELLTFIAARAELAEADHYLGTWQDVKEKLVYYDVNLLFPYDSETSRLEALSQANSLGVREGQKSIFDLATGKSYAVERGKTGGELVEL